MLSYVYEIPFLRNAAQPLVRSLLGGWQVSGVTTLQSGTPLNVTIQGDVANVGRGGQRPDLVGNPSVNCEPNPNALGLINCVDRAAFAQPAPFMFGNAPRNMLLGLGSKTTDPGLMKNFGIGTSNIQVRAEVFNAFNTVNWGSPNMTSAPRISAASRLPARCAASSSAQSSCSSRERRAAGSSIDSAALYCTGQQ